MVFRLLAGALAVTGWLAAAALLWRVDVPGDALAAPLEPLGVSGPAVERAREYARVGRLLWLGGVLAQLAALLALTVLAPRLARRLPGPSLARSLELLALTLAAAWLARLPFRAATHWWRRKHGLSRQQYLDWLASPWLELLAFAAAAGIGLTLAVLLARRLGAWWPFAAAPLLAVLGAAVTLAHPLVLAPQLEPLRDEALRASIQRIARVQGLGDLPIEVEDASGRTTTLNAEVAGIGPTQRVVLWDTLLGGRVGDGEIRFLAAHELAHLSRRHLLEGLAWFALLAPVLVAGVAVASHRRGGIGSPASVPAAALALATLQLALLPFANAVSRRYEREADWIALESVHEADAARRLFQRFARENLADPHPPGWAYVLLATHPSLEERAGLAAFWKRR